MTTMLTDPALLRLLQLSSVSLPVGGFAFSQGLEYAVEAGWVKDKHDTADWLQQQLQCGFTPVDLAVFTRLHDSLQAADRQQVDYWNSFLLACRETRELRLTDTAMGQALAKLLPTYGVPLPLDGEREISFVTAFAAAAVHWRIPLRAGALGLAWSWLENQAAAATKLVPLGQTRVQQLLGEFQPLLGEAVDRALALPDEELGGALPALAIASSLHEKQYSRLFRS